MFAKGLADGRFYPHPITHCLDFPERHSGLDHPEWAGIHSKEDDPLAAVAVLPKVRLMPRPRVSERVINIRHRRGKFQPVHLRAKSFGGPNELLANRVQKIIPTLCRPFSRSPHFSQSASTKC